jgi:KUP system potassium uptake protein
MSLSAAGMLVAIGVVYGDIGTSPLYVMQAIISGNGGLKSVTPEFIYGALSLVVWTLTLLTTIKYVLIVLRADNHGEGGVFSLYTLIKKVAPWLVVPAIIGGATTLADGILTPAVTVTSAVEGLKGIPVYVNFLGTSQTTVVTITIIIICFLFMIQRSGTDMIGKLFGPIMLIWFGMLATIGLMNIGDNFAIFKALSPVYGIKFLFSANNKAGFMLLGSVFLATTGAEALYADLGHVGRANIYGTWPWVKIALILNYFGQGAWLLRVKDDPSLQHLEVLNPFFAMMPVDFRIIGVLMGTAAAIIASQALITGSYTIVSEAIMLDLMPRLKIVYPAKTKGQLYIPIVNSTLWILCIGVVLFFRSSEHMESAYGLAITISMLMTTILLYHYLIMHHVSKYFAIPLAVIYTAIELAFTLSSLTKFLHGGYVTVILALTILSLMVVWWRSKRIERSVLKTSKLENFIDLLTKLRGDEQYPVYATNLVYLTSKSKPGLINDEILYSILDKRPKRADIYWFINVQVVNDSQALTYSVENFGTDFVFKINLWIGFNLKPLVSTYLRQIVDDLLKSGELKHQHRTYSTSQAHTDVGDFCFVLLRKELPADTSLRTLDQIVMRVKYAIQKWTVSPVDWFGLEFTDVKIEYIPVNLESSMPDKPLRVRAAVAESPKIIVRQRKNRPIKY